LGVKKLGFMNAASCEALMGYFVWSKSFINSKTKYIWEDGMPISIAAASPLWIRAICKILSLVLSSGA
jgi:hypothetical protein